MCRGAMPVQSGVLVCCIKESSCLHEPLPRLPNSSARLLSGMGGGGMCALFPFTLPSFPSSHIALPGGGDGEPL